ncbi:hypothetical protein [Globicatella sanguinis]|uniref:hypothetical protein n=1 Tax=Globicatella sanguinis TaxID=13076 RepID=UPI000C7B276D|nr:hypothetical protein [Globicatella sanguinis]MDK7630926.1 hypothetical protein [Globicatella sanguinis]WIK67408.1 hypothetical protein CYJ72_004930 [Globicatella sanguinis]WKT56813.1 hypothetical protein Q3C38_04930 [Globicatella sanguinis]
MYHFEKRKERYHVVFEDDPHYSLVDSFLQVEGASFDDIITQTIIEFLDNIDNEKSFAGNVYQITLNQDHTTIEDTLGEIEETIPTSLFIQIYIQWLEYIYPD